jgi:hypothetical protein
MGACCPRTRRSTAILGHDRRRDQPKSASARGIRHAARRRRPLKNSPGRALFRSRSGRRRLRRRLFGRRLSGRAHSGKQIDRRGRGAAALFVLTLAARFGLACKATFPRLARIGSHGSGSFSRMHGDGQLNIAACGEPQPPRAPPLPPERRAPIRCAWRRPLRSRSRRSRSPSLPLAPASRDRRRQVPGRCHPRRLLHPRASRQRSHRRPGAPRPRRPRRAAAESRRPPRAVPARRRRCRG